MNSFRVLVERVLSGDRQAFNQIYELTKKGVYYTCLSLTKNETDVKDLMQDTYLAAYSKLSSLKEPEKFQPWINQIAANRCRNFLVKPKSDSLDKMFEEQVQIADDELVLPEDYISDTEKRKVIMEIIKSLPEEQYRTIILHYFDEMTTAQIAQLMECPEGTVKYRLVSARTKIKKEVLKYEEENNDRLHAIVGIPFLNKLLNEDAQSLDFPYASIKLPTDSKASAANETNNAGKVNAEKGVKIMSTAMKKVIITAAIIAVTGGIIGGIILSLKNSDDDDRSERKTHSVHKDTEDEDIEDVISQLTGESLAENTVESSENETEESVVTEDSSEPDETEEMPVEDMTRRVGAGYLSSACVTYFDVPDGYTIVQTDKSLKNLTIKNEHVSIEFDADISSKDDDEFDSLSFYAEHFEESEYNKDVHLEEMKEVNYGGRRVRYAVLSYTKTGIGDDKYELHSIAIFDMDYTDEGVVSLVLDIKQSYTDANDIERPEGIIEQFASLAYSNKE